MARRTDQPADAADLLADVFLTAWRRLDQVPEGEEGRLWLFGVARNSLLNYKRGELRRHQLADQIRQHFAVTAQFDAAIDDDVRQALRRLSKTDREVLTLTAWEGLAAPEIAQILKVPPATIRVEAASGTPPATQAPIADIRCDICTRTSRFYMLGRRHFLAE